MKIRSLSLYNFKNHPGYNLDFDPGITCLVGNNGAGKTNVLDAVYLLANCKSYFNNVDYQLVRNGETQSAINAVFEADKEYRLQVLIEQGKKKKIRNNDKLYDKLTDHIGLLSVVFITPADISLVYENSDERRRFTDMCISQFDRIYLQHLSDYVKLLDTRNRQLKQFAESGYFDDIIIESIDSRLIVAGNYIHAKRKEFLAGLQRYFQLFYRRISGEADQAGFEYRSDLNTESFAVLLQQAMPKDRILERTSKGIHKDDLEFEIGGFPLKKYGSQGQCKSFLIALKLAQYAYQKEVSGTAPILLLDDIFEKIDADRAQNLIDLIAEESFGQIIITDTHRERVEQHLSGLKSTKKFVHLSHGS